MFYSHYDMVLDDYNYFFFVDNWFMTEQMRDQMQEGEVEINLKEELMFDPEKFIFHYNNYKED